MASPVVVTAAAGVGGDGEVTLLGKPADNELTAVALELVGSDVLGGGAVAAGRGPGLETLDETMGVVTDVSEWAIENRLGCGSDELATELGGGWCGELSGVFPIGDNGGESPDTEGRGDLLVRAVETSVIGASAELVMTGMGYITMKRSARTKGQYTN